jgi:hypothetical protein
MVHWIVVPSFDVLSRDAVSEAFAVSCADWAFHRDMSPDDCDIANWRSWSA